MDLGRNHNSEDMTQHIEIPHEVPVMTISNAVLFPQAILPLHIFEPRYRTMLSEVLTGNRIFAVASLDTRDDVNEAKEKPYSTAGIGIVRACHTNKDGSSNLVLQGLARIKLDSITTELPYRKARIHPILSEQDASPSDLDTIQAGIIQLVETQIELGAPIPKEVLSFLQTIKDAEGALDISIATLCASGTIKQELLETRGIYARFDRFKRFMLDEIEQLRIDQELKGDLGDDLIGNN